jgi:hypothetical protein
VEKDYPIYLDTDKFNRIRIFGTTERGNVKAIMCQYESLMNSKWIAIIRYDCSHGQPFHRDVMMPNGEKEKQLVEIESLNEAFTYAVQDIKDKWEFYLERYKSKIRS